MMQSLHLNLHKKWFDMILYGEKKEEYRDISDYWKVRFKNVKKLGIETIIFSNGYAKNRRQMMVNIKFIKIGSGVTEWGAEHGKSYFVIVLGEIISIPKFNLHKEDNHK